MTTTTTTNDQNRHTDVLLFDMDGVILKGWGTDASVHTEALSETLEMYDITPEPSVWSALDTYEYTETFISACETIGVDPAKFYADREVQSATRAINRLKAGERGLYTDAKALETLADEYTLGLVSNNYDPTVTFVVDHFGIDVFSFVRGRDTGVEGFTRRKPEPDYLLEGLSALDAESGFYIGDRETDIIAGKRAGLEPIFIRRSHNRSLSLSVEPAYEITSLSELPSIISP